MSFSEFMVGYEYDIPVRPVYVNILLRLRPRTRKPDRTVEVLEASHSVSRCQSSLVPEVQKSQEIHIGLDRLNPRRAGILELPMADFEIGR